FSLGERLTKELPPAVMAKDIPLADIENPKAPRYGEAGDFRTFIENDPEAREVFLGLRNLTIISDAIENIKVNRDFDLDLETLELDDRATYELLARGDTLGVFQLDGGGLQALLRLMKPDNFED
ncbi:DNA polymerase III subunit alpha, partial [Brevibacterium paucivorans]